MQDRPWMTALEMQFTAASLSRRSAELSGGLTVSKGRTVSGYKGEPLTGMTDYNAAVSLPNSVPFSWSKDTAQAVWLAAKTIPGDAVCPPDLIPEDAVASWWWFEWPLPIPTKDAVTADLDLDAQNICALLLIKESDSVIVIDFRMTSHGPMTYGFFSMRTGVTIADIERGQAHQYQRGANEPEVRPVSMRARALSRFVIAANVWMSQRILSVGSGHIERHRRKQLAREYDAIVSEVRVVQLRRAESQPRTEDQLSGDAVEWSCRWIVNGHWRNQPYANGEHKLIYILPYVKGPDDKPLKVPSHTVYAVNR